MFNSRLGPVGNSLASDPSPSIRPRGISTRCIAMNADDSSAHLIFSYSDETD